MKLTREVRCFVERPVVEPPVNTWAGDGPGRVTSPFWVVRLTVAGPVEARTGYVCDIRVLDEALRGTVLPHLWQAAAARASLMNLGLSLLEALALAGRAVPEAVAVEAIELHLSPYTSLTAIQGEGAMVRLTRSFEFAAAHRLYCADFDDEENRRVFGKCSNPNGHGHNYVLEVTVAGTPDEKVGTLVDPPQLDRIVRERVIEPFDHRNLNVECPEFASLNPSVENIARVIWRRLEGAIPRGRLASVRVWETPKTCAEYTGEADEA